MVSFKRFRKIDHSDPNWVSTIARGRAGLRGRGFAVQDGDGNLNGFRSTAVVGAGVAKPALSPGLRGAPGTKPERMEVLRVQGPSRFHREV